MDELEKIKENDRRYMKQCLEMAEEGAGKVSPNPMVGAIVLDKEGNVAGRGFHRFYGGPHAEVYALEEAGEKALDGSLYINLEPCCHHGKTPPCVNKVIKSGVRRVIIGMIDPNPKVKGRSVELMRAAHIEVTTGVLEDEAKELNKAFLKVMYTGFPLVISKIAMTLDGKIATRNQSSKWINSEDSRVLSHHWRNRLDGVLTGSSTILSDNARLNCRIPGGRDPVRVVIDSQLKTNPESIIYTQKSDTLTVLATSKDNDLSPFETKKNVAIYKSNLTPEGKIDLVHFLKYLVTEHRLHSIMLEAGPALNGAMLKLGLIDKFYVFIAPKIVGDSEAYSPVKGIETLDINKSVMLHKVKTRQIGDDVLIKAWVKDEFRRLS